MCRQGLTIGQPCPKVSSTRPQTWQDPQVCVPWGRPYLCQLTTTRKIMPKNLSLTLWTYISSILQTSQAKPHIVFTPGALTFLPIQISPGIDQSQKSIHLISSKHWGISEGSLIYRDMLQEWLIERGSCLFSTNLILPDYNLSTMGFLQCTDAAITALSPLHSGETKRTSIFLLKEWVPYPRDNLIARPFVYPVPVSVCNLYSVNEEARQGVKRSKLVPL